MRGGDLRSGNLFSYIFFSSLLDECALVKAGVDSKALLFAKRGLV